jgi:hypothetical protein
VPLKDGIADFLHSTVVWALGGVVECNCITGAPDLLGGFAGTAVKSAGRLTYLYQKVGPSGENLKFGIATNPATRYTSADLGGGNLRIIANRSRTEMLELGRNVHETLPIGAEEGQMFYIQKKIEQGLTPPPYK